MFPFSLFFFLGLTVGVVHGGVRIGPLGNRGTRESPQCCGARQRGWTARLSTTQFRLAAHRQRQTIYNAKAGTTKKKVNCRGFNFV